MLTSATARRDAFITDCSTLEEARDAAETGVARLPWEAVGASGEERARHGRPHGAVPAAQRRVIARHR